MAENDRQTALVEQALLEARAKRAAAASNQVVESTSSSAATPSMPRVVEATSSNAAQSEEEAKKARLAAFVGNVTEEGDMILSSSSKASPAPSSSRQDVGVGQ